MIFYLFSGNKGQRYSLCQDDYDDGGVPLATYLQALIECKLLPSLDKEISVKNLGEAVKEGAKRYYKAPFIVCDESLQIVVDIDRKDHSGEQGRMEYDFYYSNELKPHTNYKILKFKGKIFNFAVERGQPCPWPDKQLIGTGTYADTESKG